MVSKKLVNEFLSNKQIAVVGASRNGRAFGNSVVGELLKNGCTVYPVNPNSASINGLKTVSHIKNLPDDVHALFVALKPADTLEVVKEAIVKGIKTIWIQQQSESPEALKLCRETETDVVYEQCIIMHLQNISFPHKAHRFINKITGKLPV